MKPELIPIKYSAGKKRLEYGDGIKPKIKEVPGHFDIKKEDFRKEIGTGMKYSLHTEYSYGERKFYNPIFNKLKSLKKASPNGIPFLWFDDDWGEEFSQFIENLINENRAPTIVEIHPPFRGYCSDLGVFLKRYSIFEGLMIEKYPETKIVIENRTGSKYKKSEFLVSDNRDIKDLLDELKKRKLKLELMLDIPQLLGALSKKRWEPLNQSRLEDVKSSFLDIGEENKELIAGIHIWGRKKRAHLGTLDSLFECRRLKENFLEFISDYFDDGRQRYIVPEVNSKQEDFTSIVEDLRGYFIFV